MIAANSDLEQSNWFSPERGKVPIVVLSVPMKARPFVRAEAGRQLTHVSRARLARRQHGVHRRCDLLPAPGERLWVGHGVLDGLPGRLLGPGQPGHLALDGAGAVGWSEEALHEISRSE